MPRHSTGINTTRSKSASEQRVFRPPRDSDPNWYPEFVKIILFLILFTNPFGTRDIRHAIVGHTIAGVCVRISLNVNKKNDITKTAENPDATVSGYHKVIVGVRVITRLSFLLCRIIIIIVWTRASEKKTHTHRYDQHVCVHGFAVQGRRPLSAVSRNDSTKKFNKNPVPIERYRVL